MGKHGNRARQDTKGGKELTAFPSRGAAFGQNRFREALEDAVTRVEKRQDHDSQHGRMVHVLMENGKPCDKWVDLGDIEPTRRHGFQRMQQPKGQGNFANDHGAVE